MIEIMREDLANEGCLTKSNDTQVKEEMAEKLCREGKQGRIKVEGTFAGRFTSDSKDGKILSIEEKT